MDTQHALAIIEEFIVGDDYPDPNDAIEALETLRNVIASYERIPVTGLRQMTYCTNCSDPVDLEYADMCDRCRAVLCGECYTLHPPDCKMDFVSVVM